MSYYAYINESWLYCPVGENVLVPLPNSPYLEELSAIKSCFERAKNAAVKVGLSLENMGFEMSENGKVLEYMNPSVRKFSSTNYVLKAKGSLHKHGLGAYYQASKLHQNTVFGRHERLYYGCDKAHEQTRDCWQTIPAAAKQEDMIPQVVRDALTANPHHVFQFVISKIDGLPEARRVEGAKVVYDVLKNAKRIRMPRRQSASHNSSRFRSDKVHPITSVDHSEFHRIPTGGFVNPSHK